MSWYGQVKRFNSYMNISPEWNYEQLEQAKKVEIIAFASPSAVNAWVKQVGNRGTAVVIGQTTCVAAANAGFQHIIRENSSVLQTQNSSVLNGFALAIRKAKQYLESTKSFHENKTEVVHTSCSTCT